MSIQTVSVNVSYTHRAQIVVAGAGVAGVAAAVSAAREGKQVLLIDKLGCVGGLATIGLVTPIGSTYGCQTKESFGGIMQEIIDNLQAWSEEYFDSHGRNNVCAPHILKYVLMQMLSDAGVELLLHTTVVQLEETNGRIRRLLVHNKSGFAYVEGEVFIDTTGDGDLLAASTAETVIGNEANVLQSVSDVHAAVADSEKDNSMVFDVEVKPDDYCGALQPVSIMFSMGNVEYAAGAHLINRTLTYADLGITREQFAAWKYANTPGFEMTDDEFLPLPQGRILYFRQGRAGEVTINMSRIIGINGADAASLTKGEILAQLQVIPLVDFLRTFVPGFENAYLIESAFTLGVRETRRLVGAYQLTGSDVLHCVPMEDTVACGSYIIDIHDPMGKRMAINERLDGDFYDIPFRCLYSPNVQNLLTAGRCISADHVAHSSTRIQGTCMMTGQAAGTAAALMVETNTTVSTVNVKEVQRQLRASGVKLRAE